jgi:hypothetical protein
MDRLTLPAPHADITVHVYRMFHGLSIEYTGPLPSLLAARCLTQEEADCVLPRTSMRPSGTRRRILRPSSGKIWAKRHPQRRDCLIVTLIGRSTEEGIKLPGVAQFVQLAGRALASEQLTTPPSPDVIRSRPVGRWQRPVRWAVLENVIWPDWGRVRSDGAASAG